MFQVIQLPEQSGEQGVVQIGPGPSGLQPPTTRFLSDCDQTLPALNGLKIRRGGWFFGINNFSLFVVPYGAVK